MTSISSSMSMGRQMMDARIQQAESSGKISSADQTAFESALDNIDTSLSSSSTSADSSSGSDMKDKINGLIQEQVSAGTLTSDQASELQSLFAQGPGGPPPQFSASDGSSDAAYSNGTQGIGGMQAMAQIGGPQGMQGPSPLSPPNDSGSSDDGSAVSGVSSSTAASSSTNEASGDADSTSASAGIDVKQLDAFISFLENLRSNMSTTYGNSSSTSASSAGLVVDASA